MKTPEHKPDKPKKSVRGLFIPRVSDITKPAKDTLEISKTINKRSTDRFKARWALLFVLPTDKELEEMAHDFNLLLQKWGMSEEDIPRVLTEQSVRLLIFIFMLMLSCYLAYSNFLLAGVCIFIPSLLGVLATFWRINILIQRSYKPFFAKQILIKLINLFRSNPKENEE